MRIDAAGLHYRELNERIASAIEAGEREFVVDNVRGHRYLGCGVNSGSRLTVNGVPGNDLAAFMNGARLRIVGNAQDGVGNTMNAGEVCILGDAGDVLGHSMRGGRVFVRGRVGYRAGIHMKAYGERSPVVVIGGSAGQYLGEYMAGGVLVVLGLDCAGPSFVGEHAGTGMHGGAIFLRGKVEPWQLGREVGTAPLTPRDWGVLSPILTDFRREMGLEGKPEFSPGEFTRLYPRSSRPYGRLYAY